ncbi:MAG: LPS assembly protein LptD [Phycisphaerales bacterium]
MTISALALAALTTPHAAARPLAAQQSPEASTVWAQAAARLAQPRAGRLDASAARLWAWQEGPLHRLALSGDARINLAGASFQARHITVWIEPTPATTPDGSRTTVYRIIAYLDQPFDPGAAAGASFAGDSLLVTGVVTQPPRITADLINNSRPTDRAIEQPLADAARRLQRFAEGDQSTPATPQQRPRLDLAEGALIAPPPPATPTQPPVQPPAAPTTPGVPISPADPSAPRITQREPGASTTTTPLADPMPSIARASDEGIPENLPDPRTRPLPPAERRDTTGAALAGAGDVAVFAPDSELVLAGISPAGQPTPVSLVVQGGVVIQHTRPPSAEDPAGQPVQLSAQRAVVFFRDGFDPSEFAYTIDDIAGIYLEGNVTVTDGQSTLRGSRVYYEPGTERAIVLDAVFWTAEDATGLPLYVRAREIRQLSRREWSAQDIKLANVAFAEPHFAIGASDVRIHSVPTIGQRDRIEIEASGVSFRAAGLPLFAVPRVSGEPRPAPIRSVSLENQAGDTVLRTEWDLYTLLGLDAQRGNRADLILDAFFERGVGVGTNIEWSRPDLTGEIFAYYINDDGTDELTSGAEIDRDNDNRGIVLAEQFWRLNERWDLFMEVAYISDEAFLDSFFEREAETRRQLNTGLYLRRVEGTDALTIEIRQSLNDFISNEYLLQSKGYSTSTLPDIAYHSIARDLFSGAASYFGSARLTNLELDYSEPRMEELGFDTITRARAAFGILPGQSIEDVLLASGYPDRSITRFDTRHEFEVPLELGPISIVPYATGRLTAYDSEFTDYAANFADPDDDDSLRLWGSLGVTASTSLVRVDDSAKSELFDLDRIRHIVEPSVTVWHADTTRSSDSLPVFNDEVEAINEGTAARIGIRNTWQTMRGHPGRKRSVDWLIVDAAYTTADNEADQSSPFGRWIGYRPERSTLGEFLTADAVMRTTEALSLTGSVLYDNEENELARTSFGTLLDHGAGFSSFFEYRELHAIDATYLNAGAAYEFTRKYAGIVDATWDLDRDEFQEVDARVVRRFPQWTVEVGLSVDGVADRFGIGFSVRPVGFSGETRERIFTADPDDIEAVGIPGAAGGMQIRRGRLNHGPFQ